MRAIKILSQMRKCSYGNILRLLNLPTLKYRRMRGDMIQLFNIMYGMCDNNAVIKFNMSHVSNTRGNKYKL